MARSQRRTVRKLIAGVVGIAVLVSGALPAWGAWTSTRVTTASPAHLPSVLLGAAGGPGASWQDSTSTYWSRWDRAEDRWIRERIYRPPNFTMCRETSEDGLVMRYPWTGVPAVRGPDREARVAFACETIVSAIYFFARRTAEGWRTVPVGDGCTPDGCAFATSLDLVLDPDGATPIVIVGHRDGSVRWFRKSGARWRTRALVQPFPVCCVDRFPAVSAAIEPASGSLALAWVTDAAGGLVRYATYDDDGRREAPAQTLPSTSVGAQATGAPSLAFSDDGRPIVAFAERDGSATWLSVAVRTGATWSVQVVDDAFPESGLSPSVTVGGSSVRVVSGAPVATALRIASSSDLSTWETSTIDASFAPTYLAASATRTGELRVVAGRAGDRTLWHWSGP